MQNITQPIIRLAMICALALCVGPPARAQSTSFMLHGVQMSCQTANFQQVWYVFDPSVGVTHGGGYAGFAPNGTPIIILAPQTLNALPPLAAFFLVFHECAHHALPFGVGLGSPQQESNADCYAMQHMVNQGFIQSWQQFSQAVAQLATLPASNMGHAPGSQRIAAVANCTNINLP